MLEIGSLAPDFELKDKDGVLHKLSDYLGKKVVLYFYPKDNTSGCSLQAVTYKNIYEELKDKNYIIIGISKDSIKSHKKFIEKYELPFILLSDESTEVINTYCSWGEKMLYGRKYMGAFRNVFIIKEEGIITNILEKIKPDLDILKYL